MLNVTIVVGNPKPMSRTRLIAETLVEKLIPADVRTLDVIDLADYLDEVLRWQSESMAALTDAVARSDLAVFATPTYKATYTGLLKCFLDRYPANGLAGVTAIPVHTGADLTHSMGATFTLAPLLAELGAIVPGRGFHLPMGQLAELDEATERAAAEYTANLRRIARLAPALA
ncbi:NADPH-dependent FMN reductase [Microbacterium invictum]|uniref:FMN reductase n=1 Tax=Microbacterium invictum TaxID=515415 RepID=A0AA40SQ47_9MICO|nr:MULTISPECIES: NAD(P)H-dependent oxidoreductase [Microbacterium]MBB4140274.1 FMN reductase [Microbacterium invictum]